MSDVAITGLSVISPVGLTATHSCAAIRAGVSRFADYEGYFCLPPEGAAAEAAPDDVEPVVAARVPTLGDELDGPDRLIGLARAALQQLIAETGLGRKELRRTALFVSLPAVGPGTTEWGIGAGLASELSRRVGIDEWGQVQVVDGGAAGALAAIDAARTLLVGSRADFALLLAADTLVATDRLTALDESWRLRSTRNPDGLLPGEGGAAMLLEVTRAAQRRKATILGLPGRVAVGKEPATVSSERASSAKGLAAAIRPLLDGQGGDVGRYTLCNLNGEAYHSHEWGLAQVRLGRELPPVETLVHPADCIGDSGAAMAGVLVACACQSFVHRYAPARAALVWVSSDGGDRAAVVVRPSEGRA